MLSRRLRLSRSGFAASSRGRRAQSEHFSLSFRPAPLGEGGVAAVVSKKVAASSVARHLLKRRMLAVMEPFVRRDQALIAFAKAGSPVLPFSALSHELSGLLIGTLGGPHSRPT